MGVENINELLTAGWVPIPGRDAWRHSSGATISGYEYFVAKREGTLPALLERLSTQGTLFIGGPLDGQRIAVEDGQQAYPHPDCSYKRLSISATDDGAYGLFVPVTDDIDVLARLLAGYRPPETP